MKRKLDKYLKFCFILTMAYAVIAITFQAVTGSELSPTLTQWFYTFFGIEIGSTAFIKIFNIKKGSD